MAASLKAPFPWFGGKSRIADRVWEALGDVEHYVEPFAGSLAVLLLRPHEPRVETVNDLDRWIVNFWRAVQHDPDGVAHYANNPVNESDLLSRHIWLVRTGAERIARLEGDPDFYDVQVAGWWVWGIACWIGSGWCSGGGPWTSSSGGVLTYCDAGQGVNRKRVHLGDPGQGVNQKRVHPESAGRGVNRKRVHLGNPGQGVNRKRVHLGDPGQGVNRKLVHLGDPGQGVNRKLVHLGDAGRGVNRQRVYLESEGQGTATGEAEIAAYMRRLAERLRYVRVCCGDWQRVVTAGALSYGETVGIFLDPPYDTDLRYRDLYASDASSGHISADVRAWCLANQENPRYRIVLAGYEGEHDLPGWGVVQWTAKRSYGNASGNSANEVNRGKERLWLSPYCVSARQGKLFSE